MKDNTNKPNTPLSEPTPESIIRPAAEATKPPIGSLVFHEINKIYRAASRLQYTLLQNQDLDFSTPELHGDEFLSNLKEINGNLAAVIKDVNRIEANELPKN